MTTLLIVEPQGSNLWRVTEPDGTQHRDVTSDKANKMAYKWRATAATPEQAAEYRERQRLALVYAEELRKENPYIAPDAEVGRQDPPKGTLTPSRLRSYLASRDVGDCIVTLDNGTLHIDVPFYRLNQFGISVRSVSQ